jgi:two-component sensor histidine kinase/ligand-binding sensor domain-containing protein
MRLTKLGLIFILLISFHHSHGQNENVAAIKRCAWKTINFEQGLINNTTVGVITDGAGLTWISTLSGLQRFNGVSLEKINPIVDGDTIMLNYPVFFLSAKNGSIFIGYKKGILEYSSKTNSFTKKIIADPFSNLHYSIYPIKETDEGIWCIEEHKGFVIYHDNKIAPNQFAASERSVIDSLFNSGSFFYRSIVASDEDFIYTVSSGYQVLQINLHTHEFRYILNSKDNLISIACNKNRLFVATTKKLFYLNIRDAPDSGNFFFDKITKESLTFINIQTVNSNELLVGIGRRLYQFDAACNFQKEFTTLNRDPFMRTGYIIRTYEDKLKRIWLLTNDDIKRIEDADIPFGYFLYPKERNNFVRALYYDEQKKILLAGCYNGGIQLYDTLGNPLWDKSLITDDVKDVLSLEKLNDNDYLIVTLGKGWFILNLPAKKLRKVDLNKEFEQEAKSNIFSNSIQRISDSVILISTTANVFKCILENGKIKKVVSFLENQNSFIHPLNCFYYSSDKTLWLGNIRGLLYRVRENGDVKSINIPENYIVRCIMEDVNHNIWAGTEKGLFIFRPRGKLIKQITSENGLRNDFIYGMLPVDSTSVFASTNLGLAYISKNGVVKNYTKELGLQENEFNTQSATRSADGRFFFGGVNGITTFYPSALSSTSDTAIINITKLVVNDSSFNSSAGIWSGDSLNLNYYQNHLQISVTAIGLLNPDEYVYHYKLKGFEEVWQTAHGPTTLRYTLEPGTYFLQLNCSPLLSPNSIFSKQIVIVINPPWWQAWWVKIIAFLVLVTAISMVVLQYNRRKYQEKIRTLQLQNEIQNERERISKELHDNIGTQISYISSNVDWMLEAPIPLSKEEETKRLSAVNKTAKEMISDLRETIWAIKKESIQLEELADKLKLFVQSQRILRPETNISIVENIQSNIRFSPTEALNIFRICQEAIVNSMRHSCAAQLILNISSNGPHNFSFVIEDDGKGFTQNQGYPGHYGLENMRARANDLGAALEIISEEKNGTIVKLFKS